MSRNKLDRDKLVKKFKSLAVTAVCIQKTSKLLLQHYKYADTIVVLWYQSLCTVNSDQNKVALFYVANEVLQSKSHGVGSYRKSWKPQLVQGIEHIKDATFIDKVKRILNIWIERKVYEASFIEDLIRRLSSVGSPKLNDETTKNIILHFDSDEAVEKLKCLIKVENQVTETMKSVDIVSLNNFDDKSTNHAITQLKDKPQCHEFARKLDDNISQLFQLCSMLEEELKERQATLKLMENAEIYYETQFSETLIVEDAYRRYGNLISKTGQALEKHVDYLMDDDDVNIDVEDAPSPGKTPPYLYDDTVNTNDMKQQQPISPTQSMDMSDDDEPHDGDTTNAGSQQPYSPSNQMDIDVVNDNATTNASPVTNNIISKPASITNTPNNETKTSLSNSDALKLLTSVFTQSLTKKPADQQQQQSVMQGNVSISNNNSNINKTFGTTISNNNNNIRTEKTSNNTVISDAFKLISTLTGLKNIGERNYKSEGTSIPTIMSFNNSSNQNMDNSGFGLLQQSGTNHLKLTPVDQATSFLHNTLYQRPPNNNNINPPVPPNQIYSHQPLQTTPVLYGNINPSVFNTSTTQIIPPTSLATSINITNNNKSLSSFQKTPGSCTEDEDDDDDDGGDTPTQDEPSNIIPACNINSNSFNPSQPSGVCSLLPPVLQPPPPPPGPPPQSNAIGVAATAFQTTNTSPWGITHPPYPFNMAIPPFVPIPRPPTSTNSNIAPSSLQPQIPSHPRAIRSVRPNINTNTINTNADSGNMSHKYSPPVDLDSELDLCDETTNNPTNCTKDVTVDNETDNITNTINQNISIIRQSTISESSNQSVSNITKNEDADVDTLYADVEEELDRTMNNQQQQQQQQQQIQNQHQHQYNNRIRNSNSNNLHLRHISSNQDRYHLYNTAAATSTPRFLMTQFTSPPNHHNNRFNNTQSSHRNNSTPIRHAPHQQQQYYHHHNNSNNNNNNRQNNNNFMRPRFHYNMYN